VRSGGYLIDFWGKGYDVAERMGILPVLKPHAYKMRKLRTVAASGRPTSTIDATVFDEITHGRYFSIARSDLSTEILNACDGIEARFGTGIVGIEDHGTYVDTALSNGPNERFDLVIGADGLHSEVRSLAFGPQSRFEQRLGFHVAVFTLGSYEPRDELTAVSHTMPGRYLARVSLRGDRTLFLMVFADSFISSAPVGAGEIRTQLVDIYRDTGWESAAVLKRIGEADDLYYDRASQIRMPHWSKDRVTLVGDAAAAPSLLAGEGAGLAMTEAHVLAGELARADGAVAAAFRGYEGKLKQFLVTKQDAALRFAGYFAPKSWLGLIFRDVVSNIASVPVLAKCMFARTFRDNLNLPDYG
jgi:2-polyprenyl-6-methoxyphenol hydroxylase-like FAD-dependent oxidoreductase